MPWLGAAVNDADDRRTAALVFGGDRTTSARGDSKQRRHGLGLEGRGGRGIGRLWLVGDTILGRFAGLDLMRKVVGRLVKKRRSTG